jgi:hypothetical protein
MPRNIFVWGEQDEQHTLLTFPANTIMAQYAPATTVVMPQYLGAQITLVNVAPGMYDLSINQKLLQQYDGWRIVDCTNPSSPVVGPAFVPTCTNSTMLGFGQGAEYPGNELGYWMVPHVAFSGTTLFFMFQATAENPVLGSSLLWQIVQCVYDPGTLVISQTAHSQIGSALGGQVAFPGGGPDLIASMQMLTPSMLIVDVGIELSGSIFVSSFDTFLRYPVTGGAIQPSPDATNPTPPSFPFPIGNGFQIGIPDADVPTGGMIVARATVTLSSGTAYVYLEIPYQSNPSAASVVSAITLMPDTSIVNTATVAGSKLGLWPNPPGLGLSLNSGSNNLVLWSLWDTPNEFYVASMFIDQFTVVDSATPSLTYWVERYTVSDAGVVAHAETIQLEGYPSTNIYPWYTGLHASTEGWGYADAALVPGADGLYDVYGVVFEPATMSLGNIIPEPQGAVVSGSTYVDPDWAPNVVFIGKTLSDLHVAGMNPPFIMPTDLSGSGILDNYVTTVNWGDSLAVTSYIGTTPVATGQPNASSLRVDLMKPCLGSIVADFTLTANVKFGSTAATTGRWFIGGLLIVEN